MGRRPKILILDDEVTALEGFKMLLEEEGFDVILTSSPFALPFTIGAENPDLLLIDLSMPALQGETLLRTVPRSRLRTDAPLLLFSGREENELSALARRLGADGYISKGEDLGAILRRIRQFVRPAAVQPAS